MCGCEIRMETKEPAESTVPVIATTVITENVPDEPLPFPVVVNDTVIEASPEKVVSLSPSLTEIICEMGYDDKVIGRGSYCDYPENIASVTDVGRPSKPDIDMIISLSPDILFTATTIPTKDLYKLEECGIKTVYIPYPENMEQFENIYCAIGMIFEGIFDGESCGKKAFESITAAISDNSINLGDYVYITEGLTIATGDTFESSVLSNFGTNIAENSKDYNYPKEFLVEFQPEFILLNDNYTIDDLLADEIFSQLTAIQEGKIYTISNIYFERPSGRLVDFIGALDINT